MCCAEEQHPRHAPCRRCRDVEKWCTSMGCLVNTDAGTCFVAPLSPASTVKIASSTEKREDQMRIRKFDSYYASLFLSFISFSTLLIKSSRFGRWTNWPAARAVNDATAGDEILLIARSVQTGKRTTSTPFIPGYSYVLSAASCTARAAKSEGWMAEERRGARGILGFPIPTPEDGKTGLSGPVCLL